MIWGTPILGNLHVVLGTWIDFDGQGKDREPHVWITWLVAVTTFVSTFIIGPKTFRNPHSSAPGCHGWFLILGVKTITTSPFTKWICLKTHYLFLWPQVNWFLLYQNTTNSGYTRKCCWIKYPPYPPNPLCLTHDIPMKGWHSCPRRNDVGAGLRAFGRSWWCLGGGIDLRVLAMGKRMKTYHNP